MYAYCLVLNFGTKARFGHLFSTYFLLFLAYIYGIAAHDIMLYCAPNNLIGHTVSCIALPTFGKLQTTIRNLCEFFRAINRKLLQLI